MAVGEIHDMVVSIAPFSLRPAHASLRWPATVDPIRVARTKEERRGRWRERERGGKERKIESPVVIGG